MAKYAKPKKTKTPKELKAPKEPVFDKEKVYDEQIFPLMSKILDICKEHEMPIFASVCYRNDPSKEEHSSVCTSHLAGPGKWMLPEYAQCWKVVVEGAQAVPRMLAITVQNGRLSN